MFSGKEFEIEKIKMPNLKVKNKYLLRVSIIIKQKIHSRRATR